MKLDDLNLIYLETKKYAKSKSIEDIEFKLCFTDELIYIEVSVKHDFYIYSENINLSDISKINNIIDKLHKRTY